VPLATHRPDAPIITIDSVSKIVWSGFRVGWIRASADVIGRVRFVKALDDLGTATISQWLTLQIMDRLDTLIAQRCEHLADRAAHAHQLVTTVLPEWSVPRPMGGASLWAELPGQVAPAFVRHAARCGVLLIGDDAFAVAEPTGRHIRLPFTAPVADFVAAIERLATAWDTFDLRSYDRPRPRIALV
jgi:DNA-binding transcriptional MocR family regulator